MLRQLWRRFLAFVGLARQPDLIAEVVETNPSREAVRTGRMTIVGGPGYQKWAYFRCPCGCGEVIMLPLVQSRHPRWTVTVDHDGRPSVEPSVRQVSGCLSHFLIRQGQIVWCEDSGKPTGERFRPRVHGA